MRKEPACELPAARRRVQSGRPGGELAPEDGAKAGAGLLQGQQQRRWWMREPYGRHGAAPGSWVQGLTVDCFSGYGYERVEPSWVTSDHRSPADTVGGDPCHTKSGWASLRIRTLLTYRNTGCETVRFMWDYRRDVALGTVRLSRKGCLRPTRLSLIRRWRRMFDAAGSRPRLPVSRWWGAVRSGGEPPAHRFLHEPRLSLERGRPDTC